MVGRIIGLGCSQESPHLSFQAITRWLHQHAAEQTGFVLIGAGVLAESLKKWADTHTAGRCFGYFKSISPFHEPRNSFNRLYTLSSFYRPDKKLGQFILCGPPESQRDVLRCLLHKFDFEGDFVLPFLPEQTWPARGFDPHEPIVVHSVTRSGTMRFWPTFAGLLDRMGRELQLAREPLHSRSWMHALRHPNTQTVQTSDPVSRIRASMVSPEFRFPTAQELQHFYTQSLWPTDYYQAHLLHMHAFAPLKQLKAQYPQFRWIAFMRDPRDVMISFYFLIIHVGYYLDHQLFPGGFPYAHKEELLLSFFEQGWQYLSFNKLLVFPGLYELTTHYVDCLRDPEVIVVRFEALHHAPEQTFQDVFEQLGLWNHPLYPISQQQFSRALHLGSFEYQTRGQKTRGQAMNDADIHQGRHRRGVVGDWKNHFTPRLKAWVKAHIGDVLIELGYENDHYW